MTRRKGETAEEYRLRQKVYRDSNRDRLLAARRDAYRASPGAREQQRVTNEIARQAPGYVEWKRDYAQTKKAARRETELAVCENPDACGVCGADLTQPTKGGHNRRCIDHRHDNGVIRGVVCHRCNRDLGAVDLRYTDPERWAALLAWSSKFEPVVPAGRELSDVRHRRVQPSTPTLFNAEEN